MSRFIVRDTQLAGLRRVQRQPLVDARGFLARLFCAEALRDAGWVWPVSQLNHTLTRQSGTVRGLHFQQPPHAEAKLVSCLHGEVWDVAVDLRQGSPSFLRWHAERLSADNAMALLIPPGFAHGFQTLSDEVEMLYIHSAAYAAGAESGLHPLDPALALPWPLPMGLLSVRDTSHPLLTDEFKGVEL